MTTFAVWFTYRGPSGAQAAARPRRYAFFQDLTASGHLLASGQLTASTDPAGLLLLEADDLTEATRLLDDDPFVTEGLVANRRVEPWHPTLGTALAALT